MESVWILNENFIDQKRFGTDAVSSRPEKMEREKEKYPWIFWIEFSSSDWTF